MAQGPEAADPAGSPYSEEVRRLFQTYSLRPPSCDPTCLSSRPAWLMLHSRPCPLKPQAFTTPWEQPLAASSFSPLYPLNRGSSPTSSIVSSSPAL